MKARIEVDAGGRVTIEYEDGHVVRLDVAPDSKILRLHLGLDAEEPREVEEK